MANILPLVIGFLAKLVGLGGVPGKLVGIVKKLRAPIDKGLDKIVAWLGSMLKKLGGAVAQAGLPADPNERLRLGLQAATGAVNRFEGKKVGRLVLVPLLRGIKLRYGFQTLELVPQNNIWWIEGAINPKAKKSSKNVKIGEGESITDGDKLNELPPTEITFFYKKSLDEFEFTRQIREQEKGIQGMTIAVWMNNRKNFVTAGRDTKGDQDIVKLKAAFEDQLNGKPIPPKPASNDPQVQRVYSLMQLAQTELQRMRAEEIAKDPGLIKPQNAAILLQRVKLKFKNSAGVHRVDQYAGGSGKDIALGGAREDFSIGAAWAQSRGEYLSRAETVYVFIKNRVDNAVWTKKTMVPLRLLAKPKT
jgi:hypothetical protein